LAESTSPDISPHGARLDAVFIQDYLFWWPSNGGTVILVCFWRVGWLEGGVLGWGCDRKKLPSIFPLYRNNIVTRSNFIWSVDAAKRAPTALPIAPLIDQAIIGS